MFTRLWQMLSAWFVSSTTPRETARSHLYLFIYLATACEILVPQPEIKPMPLQWKHGVLTTGPPGKSWESLGLQGDPTIHPKGNQSWIFVERTDAEAETPILWPPDANNWFIWKNPDAGKDWRWEEKGTAQDEMVGWHHRLNGHEFE